MFPDEPRKRNFRSVRPNSFEFKKNLRRFSNQYESYQSKHDLMKQKFLSVKLNKYKSATYYTNILIYSLFTSLILLLLFLSFLS